MKTYNLTLEEIQDIVENYPDENFTTTPIIRNPDFGEDRYKHRDCVEKYVNNNYKHKQQ